MPTLHLSARVLTVPFVMVNGASKVNVVSVPLVLSVVGTFEPVLIAPTPKIPQPDTEVSYS